MNIHEGFRHGAQILAKANCEYTALHKGHGIDPHHWEILTQDEYWSPDQARQIRAILANALEVCMTISGMPAIPMPGQYVAALIAEVVAPCNRMVACMKAPDTFDAEAASGILGPVEIKPMEYQQLLGLVTIYSSGHFGEPMSSKLPEEVKENMKQASKK